MLVFYCMMPPCWKKFKKKPPSICVGYELNMAGLCNTTLRWRYATKRIDTAVGKWRIYRNEESKRSEKQVKGQRLRRKGERQRRKEEGLRKKEKGLRRKGERLRKKERGQRRKVERLRRKGERLRKKEKERRQKG